MTIRKTCSLVSVLLTVVVTATAQDTISRVEKMNVSTGSRTLSSVKVDNIKFPPGTKAPLHKHSCPVVGQIVDGVCYFQVDGEPPKVLYKNDVFYEPAGARILHFDNYSQTNVMEFTAYYLVATNGPLTEILQVEHK